MPHIVLLRGVNVGGHKTFRPKELAAKLRRLAVVNIGAAGTFVVRTRGTQAQVRKTFAQNLPFETEIVICRGSDIMDLISNDPFAREKRTPNIVRFVSILARTPREEPAYPFTLPSRGTWLVKLIGRRGRFVFGMYRRHMKTIRYLGTTDDLFDGAVTTRNWNTVEAISKVLNS